MSYLPDTNIFIQAFNSLGNEAEFLNKSIQKKKLFLSSIVIAEFMSKANDQELASLEKLLKVFPVLIIDEKIARVAAGYRKQSLKIKRVHMLDCFLAAQAKVHRLTLVTNDKADFPMKDIRIITP